MYSFDRNFNSHENVFYNTSGTWENSLLFGSLMIRPVFGKELKVSINENKITLDKCKIYPNPLKEGELNILISDGLLNNSSFNIDIYNMLGKKVYSSPYHKTINISVLSDGIYFVKVFDEVNSEMFVNKLIIAK